MGIAKLLIAHNYRVVTNVEGRRWDMAFLPSKPEYLFLCTCYRVSIQSPVQLLRDSIRGCPVSTRPTYPTKCRVRYSLSFRRRLRSRLTSLSPAKIRTPVPSKSPLKRFPRTSPLSHNLTTSSPSCHPVTRLLRRDASLLHCPPFLSPPPFLTR